MSKARAVERAKARAKKLKRRQDANGKLVRQNNHYKFDKKDFTVKGASGNDHVSILVRASQVQLDQARP